MATPAMINEQGEHFQPNSDGTHQLNEKGGGPVYQNIREIPGSTQPLRMAPKPMGIHDRGTGPIVYLHREGDPPSRNAMHTESIARAFGTPQENIRTVAVPPNTQALRKPGLRLLSEENLQTRPTSVFYDTGPEGRPDLKGLKRLGPHSQTAATHANTVQTQGTLVGDQNIPLPLDPAEREEVVGKNARGANRQQVRDHEARDTIHAAAAAAEAGGGRELNDGLRALAHPVTGPILASIHNGARGGVGHNPADHDADERLMNYHTVQRVRNTKPPDLGAQVGGLTAIQSLGGSIGGGGGQQSAPGQPQPRLNTLNFQQPQGEGNDVTRNLYGQIPIADDALFAVREQYRDTQSIRDNQQARYETDASFAAQQLSQFGLSRPSQRRASINQQLLVLSGGLPGSSNNLDINKVLLAAFK